MRICLISDTHGFIDKKLFGYLESCDEVWHAGDIGSRYVLDEIGKHKPLKSVIGNIDNPREMPEIPEDLMFDCEGLKILITHIAGSPPNYNSRVRQLIADYKPDVLICGHSHILKVVRDSKYNLMFLNPGACGNHGFHRMKTILRFTIDKGKMSNMEVVELGRRGELASK